MTAQELKNSILQLAVQGKLVPQYKDDEPASELLKQIELEKSELIIAGKIKKYKLLSELSVDDYPFDIPESWTWVKLGYICQFLDGVKICGKKYPYLEAKYLRGKTDATILNEGKFVEKGTRLILVDGENSGEVFNATEDGYMGSTFKVLFFPKALFEGYVLNFLLLKKSAFRNNKTGSAIPHLNKELFFNMPFPIPPLAEQKRIVEKIEELMPLIEEYGKAEEQLGKLNAEFPDKLRKSILQQAVQGKPTERDPADEPASELLKRIKAEKEALIKAGKIKKEKPLPAITDDEKPFDIPDTWEWVRLGAVSEIQSSKRVFEKDYVSHGIPFFRSKEIGDLYRGKDIQTQLFIAREHYEQLKKDYGVPKIGDILITSVGTIGNTWICDGREFYYKDGNITQICSNKFIYPRFLQFYIESPLFLGQANTTVSGTAYNALTIIKLKQMMLPLPPLAEQKRIVKRVEELLALCDELLIL